jgi:mannose-1-phosphate guanylyltransferase/phosphomannomutase
MLPVAGRPLLEHVVRHLAAHGFDELAINLHVRPELIRENFGDGASLGVRIVYSHEPELLGTAGALTRLREFLGGGGPFLVHYGDVITRQDLSALADEHVRRGAFLTLLVHYRRGSNSVVVLDEERRMVDFAERPAADDPVRLRSSWTNSGIWMCSPELLDLVPPPPSDLARDLLPRLVGRTDVYAEVLTAARVAVDSPERYREAEVMLASPVEESRS